MAERGSSPSSSIDSNSHPALSITSSLSQPRRDSSTDLRLGLSITTSSPHDISSNAREQLSDWPPIKPLLRSTLIAKGKQQHPRTFFVKVYMDGIPIGRKLDLFAHDGYTGLIRTLCLMFRTSILYPGTLRKFSNKSHVLTYEDKEGDWMMVGDVPWDLFLATVKRLKITRGDRC